MPKYLYSKILRFYKFQNDPPNYNEIYIESREIIDRKRYREFCQVLHAFFVNDDINKIKEEIKPFLIRINDSKNSLRKHNTFVSNSSIWFRTCDLDDNELYDATIRFFDENKELYKLTNSKENLDFNLRLQQNNYLYSLNNGHGHHITPKIYNNEYNSAFEIININTEDDIAKCKYPEIQNYHDITFRILLIDDKIGKKNDVSNEEKSKIEIIGDLMTGRILKDFAKIKISASDSDINKYIHKRLLWKEKSIEKYIYSPSVKIDPTENVKILENINDLSNSSDNINIIQVSNLEDTITLLSNEKYKFDLILMDYLLEPKAANSSERELVTGFFEWLKDKDGTNSEVAYLKKQLSKINDCKSDCSIDGGCCFSNKCFILNEKIRAKVSRNRGPLRKFWFFPITAFNDTLISDLTSKGIRLIDYYWHIEHGADPVTTPYLFLRQLNNFLYLQLEEAVFSYRDLARFIEKDILLIEGLKLKNNNKLDFQNFSALMGAEYSKYINDFLNRPLIFNDKETSLFSKYIWEKFMTNKDNETLFLLVQAYHKFLHRCAYGSKSDYKKMKYFWTETLIVLDQLKGAPVSKIRKMNIFLNDLKFE